MNLFEVQDLIKKFTEDKNMSTSIRIIDLVSDYGT